jgi:hypothetical protein
LTIQFLLFHTTGPIDLLHLSAAPHFENFMNVMPSKRPYLQPLIISTNDEGTDTVTEVSDNESLLYPFYGLPQNLATSISWC